MDFIDLSAQQKIIKEKIEERISNVLDHGQYIMGPEVFELEENLKSYVGVKHCITCSSGTDALLIPLMAKGIGPGDAVITTAFSYIATAEVIALLGATPIFCDIYPNTFNLNPNELEKAYEKALKEGLHPKAIIPVDLFGLPARYRLISEFAKTKNLFILEDAAQGFGGSIGSKKTCTFGDVSSTSFFPAKPLGCYGDGGAIFTNNDELAEKMSSIRVHGGGENKYDNIRLGLNGRLDTLQAAVLIEKLKIFDSELIMRNDIAKIYSNNIKSNYIKPYIPKNYISSWAQYSVVVSSKKQRDKIVDSLRINKIPSMVYYKIPLHLQKVFKYLNYRYGDLPKSEDVANRIISLPMHPYLEKRNQNIVTENLNSI
ncbi:DegT/DnrJ/EryC1/StrS family aminotransferase [Candidatus Marinimicrobia bacterium]|nr:DegT/DnrJ/EryC1/StrS family aminotransferase [Candidatus Neomarinimicrobiota bacterium]